ncbi:cyclic nucleotide-binding domain-containing protein [bacterium]|nr:cyclic nucleotide-binding domain-containing protein [bacterium]
MSRFAFFLTLSLLMNLSQTVGLVISESMLLTHYGPASLPVSFLIAAVVTVLGSLIYALGVHRAKNDRYFLRLLGGLASLIVLTWACLQYDLPGMYFAPVSLYFLSQCILTNHYWTFTGDFFDTLAAKRLFPLFVVGSSLGGMLGALLLSLVNPWLAVEQQMLLWPLFLLCAMVLVRLTRRPLRRWGPLELEEADETSISEMRNAALYLRQSSLGRQLVVSCACMILAGFLGQYLYSSIILRSYPDSAQLAAFLSRLLALTNALEIVVEVGLTPWLIRSLGVANANQVHSALTCGSFLAICLAPGLATAVALRCTRESLENAVASPIRSLVYNALPARSRGRVRAFLEGLVTYTAMALAGLILLAVGSRAEPESWMFYLGLITAALYFGANWVVRTSYLRTMIEEVQAGRLDLDELSGGFAASEAQRLTQLWQDLCREASQDPDPALLRLAQTLGGRQNWSPLTEAAAREDAPAWLRRVCLQALAQPGWHRDWRLLQECAAHAEAEVRLAALRAVGELKPGLVPTWLVSCMQDGQPEVRALACSLLLGLPRGQEAREAGQCLLAMLGHQEVNIVVAALRCTPLPMSQELLQRCGASSARVARAALLRLADFHGEEPGRRGQWVEAALKALERPEAQVRRAALQLLHSHHDLLPADTAVWQRICGHLEESSKANRDRAIALLSVCPLDLGPLLKSHLESASGLTARAAVLCLSQSPRRESREALHQVLRSQVQQLWVCSLLQPPAVEHHVRLEYLHLCLDNARERSRKLIFDILAGLETPKVIRSVEKVLRFTNVRARADALEVLSNLGDREASQLLVLLLESGELRDKLNSLPQILVRMAEWDSFCASNWLNNDPWLRQAVGWVLDQTEWQTAQEETVERLLVLRKVPLFAQMNLEQLVAIDQRLEEVEYLAGEVVFEEGQLGAELYILLDGLVKIVKAMGTTQELVLTRLEGVNYFGEMAILDDEPRSASVVVERNSRLLVLKGEQLKDLVEQMPEMAFEIIKVLTARIRQADERLKDKSK